jgi:hypothetical protein
MSREGGKNRLPIRMSHNRRAHNQHGGWVRHQVDEPEARKP